MGRIKTKDIKRLTFGLIESYPEKFIANFEKNKEILGELAVIPDKRVRNKVAGYLTKIVKRKKLSKPFNEPAL